MKGLQFNMIKVMRYKNFRIIQKKQLTEGNCTCEICGNKFKGNSKSYLCGECYVVLQCCICKKYYALRSRSSKLYDRLKFIEKDENIIEYFLNYADEFTCSRSCATAKKNYSSKSYGICGECGKERDLYYGVCSECRPCNQSEMKFCEICGKDTPHRRNHCMACQAENMRTNTDYFGSERSIEINRKNVEKMNEKNRENDHWNSPQMKELNSKKAYIMIQYNHDNGIYKKNGIRMKYCPNCKVNTYHNGKTCLVCHPEITNNRSNYSAMKFCKNCKMETPHKYNNNDELYCECCAVERIYYTNWDRFITVECYNQILEDKFKLQQEIEFIYRYNIPESKLSYIKSIANSKNMTVYQYVGTFTYCSCCKQWEDPEYKSISNHLKNNRNNQDDHIIESWSNKHKDDVQFLIENIEGYKNIYRTNKIGIYFWKIDNIPYYYGQSNNIYRRSREHFVTIIDDKEYWLNIIDQIKNGHKFSLDFFECSEEMLDYYERLFILRDMPMSQICIDNEYYDNIIPYELREYNIDNLQERYIERLEENSKF